MNKTLVGKLWESYRDILNQILVRKLWESCEIVLNQNFGRKLQASYNGGLALWDLLEEKTLINNGDN